MNVREVWKSEYFESDCDCCAFRLKTFREDNPLRFNGYGSEDRADLILSRALGMFSLDRQNVLLARNQLICEGHVKKLLTKWSVSRYNHFSRGARGKREPICSFTTKITGSNLPKLTKQQAQFVFNEYRVLLHIGLRKFIHIKSFKGKFSNLLQAQQETQCRDETNSK
jgi:hypothetical protein